MSIEDNAPTASFDRAIATGSERQVLDEFLNYYRQIIKRKVHGVAEDKARQRLVGSLTTLAGLLKHLAAVEREWFQHTLGQLSAEQIGAIFDGQADAGWQVAEDETVPGLIAEYEQACARSREIAAQFDLDHQVPHPYFGQVSLRWIYVHLIEETARHVGHADILREQTDGSTGS
ncbi:MAG TPA: DinB family protein [Pseudonocardiaceae bacterium]|nr:DinB family protein [Pseudonocardiaceae bacterium]